MGVRIFVQKHWTVLTLVAVAAAITSSILAIVRTMPPRTITMATGPEGGAYHEIGKRYQVILARAGVRLELLPTSGSPQNLALLREPHSDVHVALI